MWDVDGMMAVMSSALLTDWMTYFKLLDRDQEEREMAQRVQARLDAAKVKNKGNPVPP